MADSRLASVTSGSTIDHNRKTTKIIVDPHETDSFVIDLTTMKSAQTFEVKEDGSKELRKLEQIERSKMIANSLRRFAKSTPDSAPPSLGTVSGTVDGGNHVHPAAQLPESAVAPPNVRVYFDMPGLATLNYRYHGAAVVPGYLVLTTDMRYAGPGEFYPFTSKLAIETDARIGVMVDGIDSLFLIKPPTIQHKFGPYEHCLVPIVQEKDLPPELKEGLVQDKPEAVETSPHSAPADAPSYTEDGVL